MVLNFLFLPLLTRLFILLEQRVLSDGLCSSAIRKEGKNSTDHPIPSSAQLFIVRERSRLYLALDTARVSAR